MHQPAPIRLGVLLSGGGRTLQNFCDEIAAGRLNATIALVVSSSAGAFGVQRARRLGLPTVVLEPRDHPGKSFDEAITACLTRANVDLVCMAGFLRLWTVPPQFTGRVMNIHPAVLPDFGGQGFYGHRVHDAVLAAGCTETGCTVHFCDNQYDQGPVILQRRVPVLPGDTPDTLAARVFEQECIAYPEAIRLFAAGRLQLEGGRVTVLP